MNKQTDENQSKKSRKSRDKDFVAVGDLFSNFTVNDGGGYISQEFQDYGYRLAVALDDLKHKALYIKMAKEVDRVILESALMFVIDAENARSKPKLFMWKVKQIKDDKLKKNAKEHS